MCLENTRLGLELRTHRNLLSPDSRICPKEMTLEGWIKKDTGGHKDF